MMKPFDINAGGQPFRIPGSKLPTPIPFGIHVLLWTWHAYSSVSELKCHSEFGARFSPDWLGRGVFGGLVL